MGEKINKRNLFFLRLLFKLRKYGRMKIRVYSKRILKQFEWELVDLKKESKRKKVYAYNLEKEANYAIEPIKQNTMVSHSCLVTLYQQVRYILENNIEGDLVECGVWKGGCVGLMAQVQKELGSFRDMHIFDSFIGLPKACEKDSYEDQLRFGISSKDVIEASYDNYAGENFVKDLLFKRLNYPSNRVKIHKGWFQETIPIYVNNCEKIALLRLDGDLYESTKICIDNLWPKLSRNGILIIDDYAWHEGCKNAIDEYFSNIKKPYFNEIYNSGAKYLIKTDF